MPGAARCKRCTYVYDEDEWVCESCGATAPADLAGILTRAFLRSSSADFGPETEDDAEFDADELGLTEDEDPNA